MKKMLLLASLLALAIAIPTTAYAKKAGAKAAKNAKASTAGKRGEKNNPWLARLDKKVHLTADQMTQAKKILEQARTDAKQAGSRQAKQAVRKAAHKEIKSTVLTDDQRQMLKPNKAGKAKAAKAARKKAKAARSQIPPDAF